MARSINKNLKSSINIEVSSFNPAQRKPVEPKLEYKDQYLTFKALENCEIRIIVMSMSWQQVFSVSYSINNGKSWNLLEINYDMVVNNELPTIPLQRGKTVLLKSIHGVSLRFKSSGKYDVYGNIMSLLHEDDFKDNIEIDGHPFTEFFMNETKLINAKNLILPKFTNNSYNCYVKMFWGCTSLITAPALPATTLADFCYTSMFAHCTSLKTAPALPAITLANNCYNSMFWDCTSLINPPKLPATILANSCYKSMFNGCTSLTTAPELPATTLEPNCYESMFYNCSNLNYIKALFITYPDFTNNYISNWVYNVAQNGTFIKNAIAEWESIGPNGIPEGWVIELEEIEQSQSDELSNYSVNIDLREYSKWNEFGVHEYGDYRIFIKKRRIPNNFPYTGTYTGKGGVLLIMGKNENNELTPFAFELSCPIENTITDIINIDNNLDAVCSKCNSHFDIINGTSNPKSGPALNENVNLKSYKVRQTTLGGYIISNI